MANKPSASPRSGPEGPTETYTVRWEIDVDAISYKEAAQLAQNIQRDPASIATVFEVKNKKTGHKRTIDLLPQAEAKGQHS